MKIWQHTCRVYNTEGANAFWIDADMKHLGMNVIAGLDWMGMTQWELVGVTLQYGLTSEKHPLEWKVETFYFKKETTDTPPEGPARAS